MKEIVIVGGGFAGLNAAKRLHGARDARITLIDRENHHLFQPLLYQVAMAALSPADIAVPIRSLLSPYRDVRVLKAEATRIDPAARKVVTDIGDISYDYLLVACGDHAEDVVAGARAAGMPQARSMACRELNEVLARGDISLRAGDVVLVKGSRAMAMERLVQSLQELAPCLV